MVDHFNFISHRVASDIVKCNIFEKRVEWLQFWISVAEVNQKLSKMMKSLNFCLFLK